MATIQITIPDAVAPRVADAFVGIYPDQFAASGLTKAQFIKERLINHLSQTVTMWEGQQASESAKANAEAQARAEIVPT